MLHNAKLISITPDAEKMMAYCARVSSKNQANENITGLLKYCAKHGHWCHDAKTQVLTSRGWLYWPDVQETDYLAQYNADTKQISFTNNTKLHKSLYNGLMNKFVNKQSEFFVTDEHRMLTDSGYILAKDLPNARNSYKLPTNGFSSGLETYGLTEYDAKLIGFWFGDGFTRLADGDKLYFNIKQPREVKWLKTTKAGKCYAVQNAKVNDWLKLFCIKDGSKYFSHKLFTLPQNLLLALLDGLFESSGSDHDKEQKTGLFDNANLSIIEGFETVARLCGYSTSTIKLREQRYRVFCLEQKYAKHMSYSKEQYSDFVYCAAVPDGNLLTRRSGKISISGNSVFEVAHMTVEITTTRAISPQILRHRSMSFQEFSQRYAAIGDNSLPTLLQVVSELDWRLQDKANRQNSLPISEEQVTEFSKFTARAMELAKIQEELYEDLLSAGIAKECARNVLPICTPTRLYMAGTIRSFIHYVNVRADKATQLEHRLIAESIKAILIDQLPIISKAVFQ